MYEKKEKSRAWCGVPGEDAGEAPRVPAGEDAVGGVPERGTRLPRGLARGCAVCAVGGGFLAGGALVSCVFLHLGWYWSLGLYWVVIAGLFIYILKHWRG